MREDIFAAKGNDMKAIRLDNYGSAEQLVYGDLPLPSVNEGQVLVRIHAASVNQIDWKKASGAMNKILSLKFPWIPGQDFSGTVEAVGASVTNFNKGDKVYGSCREGAYAEYVAADPGMLASKPSVLDHVKAAAVPHVAQTAWQGIFKYGNLKAGERVLIHGAAGAVGAYAVQFARLAGATVYATASGRDLEYVKSLGALVVIDYKTEDFTAIAKDMDLVLDLVGGDTQKKSYSILKPGGCLVSTVGQIMSEEAEKYTVRAIAMAVKPAADQLIEISRLVDAGDLLVDVASVYPLNDAADAWNEVLGKDKSKTKKHGKVVLKVLPD